MKTSRHIDWLSITIGERLNWKALLPFQTLVLIGKGRHGYRQRWEDTETGAIIETGSDNTAMGSHFTLTGGVLSAMRDEFGMTDDGLIDRLTKVGAKCSRIDIAVDCWNAEFTPAKLAEAIRDGSAKWHARTWRYIDGLNTGIRGSTVDTGSTKSDRRFRFYDKRAEQRIKDGESWVRLEMQLRRLYAKKTVVACSQKGTSATIAGCIGGYLEWSEPEYRQALTGDYAEPEPIPRPDSNRRKWLLGQVAMALARELHHDPAFVGKFWTSVGQFLDNLTDEEHNGG